MSRAAGVALLLWAVLATAAGPAAAQPAPAPQDLPGSAPPGTVPAREPGDAGAFRVEELAPGALLFRPASATSHANSLVFERSDGLLVVDAQPSPEAARDFLAALRSRTSEPIRYLVFSHPHLDAFGGAGEFPAGALRIASRGYRDALAEPGFDPAVESRLRRGSPAEGEPTLRAPATLVLFGRTRLEDARNPLILLPVPHAHSIGDLLVYQPETAVVAAGDLAFTDGRPFAGDARIGAWIGQLDLLRTMSPTAVVPLRGSVLDSERLRAARNALDWVRERVDDAFRERMAPEEIPAAVLASGDLGRYFSPGPGAPFLRGLIDRVIEEARERRRQEGLE